LTVKSLALEPEMERRWEVRLANSAFTSYRAGNLSNVAATLGYLLQMVASLAILSVGAILAIEGEMTVGALIACNMLANRVLVPLRVIATAWHQVQETKEAFRRINEVMEEAAETPPGTASPTPELRGRIQFEAVDFSFEPGQAPTLRGIDLSIDKGSVIGVIGPSGSGKSTLAKLMQGLYRPSAGRVTIDGTDVQHMSLQALRQQIGVVPQDNQLFAGTVRENIQMGALSRDPDRVVAVAKFVGAHDFIQRLPKGYETVLGERGVGLSNGQRQLLCIARALVRNPRILILDEATSDLDPVAEDFLLRNLQRAARGRTIVIVTHRLAPLAIADRVALLIEGRIERVGPPAEVIAFAKTRMAEVAMPR
jgi:ABC-type bacteriocin/lantibiotic exporter with double-glycine peptidase domain